MLARQGDLGPATMMFRSSKNALLEASFFCRCGVLCEVPTNTGGRERIKACSKCKLQVLLFLCFRQKGHRIWDIS